MGCGNEVAERNVLNESYGIKVAEREFLNVSCRVKEGMYRGCLEDADEIS